ncbi:MAG TPA: toast rack family protein [Anaerolineales bacterium]|nr:toast rack family protein [Anaerolineales bacterium]HMX76258.1 toast rack family protein [Anaerolineales bacterium]
MLRKLILLIAILALTSMACGFNINIPDAPKPGPQVTDDINVKAPKADDINLKLSFGAGEMILAPGADQLVAGTASYNYSAFKPNINTDGGNVSITMSEVDFKTFPNFNEFKNKWDFELSDTPMNLSIESGAYDGTFELGGLALENLSIKDGAANVVLSFSEPNLSEMSTFVYETGASDVKMTGLANANFSLMDFSSGAGDYTLDFSGELQRDASIKISSGLSNIIIVVPEGVNAVVTMDGGASNISVGSSWSMNGGTYMQKGEGPTLTFVIEIGAGNVTLTH